MSVKRILIGLRQSIEEIHATCETANAASEARVVELFTTWDSIVHLLRHIESTKRYSDYFCSPSRGLKTTLRTLRTDLAERMRLLLEDTSEEAEPCFEDSYNSYSSRTHYNPYSSTLKVWCEARSVNHKLGSILNNELFWTQQRVTPQWCPFAIPKEMDCADEFGANYDAENTIVSLSTKFEEIFLEHLATSGMSARKLIRNWAMSGREMVDKDYSEIIGGLVRQAEYGEFREGWVYQDCVYSVSQKQRLTQEEESLLVMSFADRQRQQFERLRNRMSSTSVCDSRERIPEDVRIFVWRRDEGKCVSCGSRENLEYDHVIPVSKGGSTTARNIELLCERCNRQKGAEIQ